MPAGRLVGDSVVDDVEVLGESLGDAPLGVADQLLLAFCAGYQVNQVTRSTVHVTINPHRHA